MSAPLLTVNVPVPSTLVTPGVLAVAAVPGQDKEVIDKVAFIPATAASVIFTLFCVDDPLVIVVA